MRLTLRTRDNDIAHLGMPSQDDLRCGFAVFTGKLREHSLVEQRLIPMPQRIPGHDLRAHVLKKCLHSCLRIIRMRLRLQYRRFDLRGVHNLFDHIFRKVGKSQ